jgi:WD40 repeat protein/tRNA A-37 threonylcarbamoyl transferase component Bud32
MLLGGLEFDAEGCAGGSGENSPPIASPLGGQPGDREPVAANVGSCGTLPCGLTETPGEKIGRYKLLQKIGEGGYGMVYMAEQEEPFRRHVALKVIKLGMDTRQVISRFEAERQALALMDHPNIARVLDAGATASGRPFFVMELVRGTKITEYCDQNNLPTKERLQLLMRVCQAIQHAHQKGIIHRDIKPSNILVSLHDGAAVPKVIDFGIAKATDQRLTDNTKLTAFEQFIGTPAYMSPEQAETSGLDIDTRTDIYSLGVLLYELLTGKTPFDQKELLRAGVAAMRLRLRTEDPIRPSTRLSTMAEAERTNVAKHRQSDVPRLVHLFRGDLDWIVLKCLEKDRTRRYETASGLAMDIRRHLNDEPVTARPPGKVYQFQKLVHRNKLAFAAAAAVAMALVIGAVGSGWQTVKATRARGEADAARLRADQNATRAERERERAKKEQLRAESSELVARQKAYAADMNLAQQALAINNLGRAKELLERNRPSGPQQDLRGWEWRYLWQQSRGDFQYTICQKTNPIFSLAVSADEKWLALGDEQGGLSIWDLPARHEIASLPAGHGEVRVALSPREALLAYSTDTTTPGTNGQYSVRLWKVATREIVTELPLTGLCIGLEFSTDGQKLITSTGDPDNQITLWTIPEGKKLAAYPARQIWNTGTPFAVARDLSAAAHAMDDGRLGVIDLATGKERWSAKAADDVITALAISPDGKTLASGAGFAESTIRLWDLASGREITRLQGHRAWVSQLVFWPDGKTMASASGDQTIRLWDTTDFQPLRTLRGHRLEVYRLALLGDQRTLVSGCKDGSVYAWNTAMPSSGRNGIRMPSANRAWHFSPDSKSILTCDSQGRVARWQAPDFKRAEPLVDVGTNILEAQFSGDCRLLALASTNGGIQVWDLNRRALLREFSGVESPWGVALLFMQEDRKLLALYYQDSSLHEWDLTTVRETKSWAGIAHSFGGAVSADGRWLVLLGWNGKSLLRDLATGRETTLEIGMPWDATFSPDGKFVAIASTLGFAGLWETATQRESGAFRDFLLGVHSVAFSPDGKRLAAGSNGQEALKLWDIESHQELIALEGQGSMFHPSAFSPDGNLLGSCNVNGVLHLWRAPSWAEIATAEQAQ